jgi:glycosyltransferase involved in cell wall biosynthesis
VIGRVAIGVYVDSGSDDGSPELARSLGFDVVELDLSIPFTAARARNAGIERLVALRPDVEFVQFVDGDCELRNGWLERGLEALTGDPSLGAVSGRLRERHPDASIYNRLCDLEWDHPPGYTDAVGGIAMLRVAPFREIGGFDPAILAGEEAEMYRRLSALGFKVRRLPEEMALHDVDMTHFSQWWQRSVRSGHAYAEVSDATTGTETPLFARELRSNWLYGAALPGMMLATLGLPPLTLGIALAYPTLFLRVYRSKRAEGQPERIAALYAAFIVIGKFPSAFGQAVYFWNKRRGSKFRYAKVSSGASGTKASS